MPVYIDSIIDELSIRSGNVLKARGITMLEELTFYTDDEMLKWKNMGRKSVKELKKLTLSWNIVMGSNRPTGIVRRDRSVIKDMYVQFGEGLPERLSVGLGAGEREVNVKRTRYKFRFGLYDRGKDRFDWFLTALDRTAAEAEDLYSSRDYSDRIKGAFTSREIALKDFRIFCDEMRKMSVKTERKKIRKLEKIEGWTVGEVGIKNWTLEKELGPTPPPAPRTSDSARYMLFIQAKAARDGTDQLTLKLARIPSWNIRVQVQDIGLARGELRGTEMVGTKVGVVRDSLQAPWHYGDPKDWRAAVVFAANWANNEIIKHDRLEAKASPKKKARPTQRQLEQSMREAIAKRQTRTQQQDVIHRQFGTCKRCRVCLAYDVNQGCCTVCSGPLFPNPKKRRRKNAAEPLHWSEEEDGIFVTTSPVVIDGDQGDFLVSRSGDEWLVQFAPWDEKPSVEIGEAPSAEEAKGMAGAFYMAMTQPAVTEEAAPQKKATKKATKKRKKYETLIGKSRRLWDSYVEKPTKRGLKSVLKHLEDMEKSTSTKVKREWRKAKRSARAEAKDLGMLFREKPKRKKRKKRS